MAETKSAPSKGKEAKEVRYEKAQLMKASRYARDVDILAAILDDKQTYTFDDVDKMLKVFKAREVQ